MSDPPSFAALPFPRDFEPLRKGDPPSLLERGSNFLPYEREMRARWESWNRAWATTPPGERVEGDLVAILREVHPPLGLSRVLHRRPAFRPFPLPGRPTYGPTLVLEDPKARPREGTPYRIPRPRKVVKTWKEPPTGTQVEEVLWAEDGVERLADSEFYLSDPGERGRRERVDMGQLFSEAAGVDRAIAQAMLLPMVGAPPWHGRPPGVDLVLGSWDTTVVSLAPIPRGLAPLLPPWAALSGGRSRSKAAASAGAADELPPDPYHVRFVKAAPRAFERLGSKSTSFELSTLLYGGVQVDHLGEVLFGPHLPLIEPPDRWVEIPEMRLGPEVAGPLSDALVRAHFREPEGMDGDALHAALDPALARVRGALRQVPQMLNLPTEAYDALLFRSLPLRDHLVQSALSFARLRGGKSLEPGDFVAVSDRYVDSLSSLSAGGSSGTRALLTLGGRIRSRKDLTRFFVLRSAMEQAGDLSVGEVWEKAKGKHHWKNVRELEEYLDRMAQEGVLVSLRPATYRWEGL